MANLSNINGKFVVEQTTGYVGVGTTDPNFLIEAAGANSEIALNSTSASIYRLRSTSSDSFIITKNGVGDRLVIDGSGNSTFAGQVTTNSRFNSTTAQALHFPNYTGTGWQIGSDSTANGMYIYNENGTYAMKLTNAGNATFAGDVNVQGNLTLSVASSFINTAAGDLYINPASNNTTLYDGANAQIFNVYNAGNLAIKLNSGTGGGVLLARDGINFESSYSGNGLVLSHHGIGPSNAIVSGNSVYPDNLFINSGGAASDWSNVTIYGNVGINKTDPAYKLHIRGGSATEETVLKIDKSSAADSGGHTTIIGLGCESAGWAKAGIAFERTGAYDTGKMHFLMYPTGLNTNTVGLSNSVMTINNNGNIGIGTNSPDRELDIQASSGWAEIALRGNTGGGGSLEFWTNTTKRAEIFADTEDIVFRNTTSNVERMRITSDGKVGINTSSFAPTISNQLKLGNMGSGAVGEVLDAGVVNGAARMIICAGGATGQVPILSLRHYSAAYGIDIWTYWASPWNTYIDNRHPSSGFIFRNNCNASGGENALMEISGTGRISMYGLDGKTQVHPDVSYRISDGELFYQSSSIRYKKDVVNLENSLNKINALRPVRFKEKSSNEPSFGLIAEETVEVIPEVVFKKEIEGFDEEQIEGVSYSNLVPFLIKAIQELKADNDSLKARIETLENN